MIGEGKSEREKLENLLLEDVLAVFPDSSRESLKSAIWEKIVQRASLLSRTLGENVDPRRYSCYWREVKRLRKIAYYELRRFKVEGDTHLSLKERGENVKELISFISSVLAEERVEVMAEYGCGLFPLTLPMWGYKPRVYIAVDKSQEVIKRLEKAVDNLTPGVKLIPVRCDIAREGVRTPLVKAGFTMCDLAFFNRIIHVLERTSSTRATMLVDEVPAKIVVVSEPRVSLVKKNDITAREKRFLLRLASKLSNQGVISEYKLALTSTDVVLLMKK